MLLLTWERRVRADCWSPSRAAEITSSSDARVTEAKKNALATLIESSWAFAKYFEAARFLVTGSTMEKIGGFV